MDRMQLEQKAETLRRFSAQVTEAYKALSADKIDVDLDIAYRIAVKRKVAAELEYERAMDEFIAREA